MSMASGETESRLEAIIESAVDGIIAIDENGVIESANRATERIFGYERHDLLGSPVTLLMPSPYREEHHGYIKHYLETGEPRVIGIGREVRGLRRDGSEFPLYLAISEGWHGGERLFTGIVRDLSDLRIAEERARAAEQLASLSVITAGIAHDIGTPMNVILGYADMLRDSLESPKDRRRAAIISDQVRRVTSLIQTLLNIARPQKMVRVPIQLAGVVDHALDFFREKLRSRAIEVERSYARVPEIAGDRDRLEQTFLNLIVNAADAMPRGGKLAVKIESGDDGWVELTMRDTGHGIPADSLERIFEPFHTTKAPGEGTGLGLVVSRSIILDHGGQVRVESEVDEGTCFHVRFPPMAVPGSSAD
jgi:PAS domain S-box-containing protein